MMNMLPIKELRDKEGDESIEWSLHAKHEGDASPGFVIATTSTISCRMRRWSDLWCAPFESILAMKCTYERDVWDVYWTLIWQTIQQSTLLSLNKQRNRVWCMNMDCWVLSWEAAWIWKPTEDMSNEDVRNPYSPYQWYTAEWEAKQRMYPNSVYHPFFPWFTITTLHAQFTTHSDIYTHRSM